MNTTDPTQENITAFDPLGIFNLSLQQEIAAKQLLNGQEPAIDFMPLSSDEDVTVYDAKNNLN